MDHESCGEPLTRRAWLRLMAAAAARPARASGAPAPLERPIPSSGEKIPVVGLGTWRTFDVGASAAERAPLEEVLRSETLDFVQVNYSLGERDAERRILPLARDRGVAVLANRPFAEGGLFQRVRGQALPPWAAELDCESWAQLFLKWILAHPAVTCVIPATSRPQHLVDNMKAGTGNLPDSATRERMAALIATR